MIITLKDKISRYYRAIFKNLDLSSIPEYLPSVCGPKGYSRHALLKSFIVMKLESINLITELRYFLQNHHSVAKLCGFQSLPSYSVFQRYIKNVDNNLLTHIMNELVKISIKLGFVKTENIAIDSTPIFANTKYNNPKCFSKHKFSKKKHPKSDKDCALGIHSANNEDAKKNYKFFWGYKNTIVCDVDSGLPIYEKTATANVSDYTETVDILTIVNEEFNIKGCNFIADKGYDTKNIHNFVRFDLKGFAYIAQNKRNTKKPRLTPEGHMMCDAGLIMRPNGKQYFMDRTKYKYICPFRRSSDDKACPCGHKKYFNGKKHRGCTKYVTVGCDYRSSIDTTSAKFKKIYALRTESERLNSRIKSLEIEHPMVRNISSIKNFNTLASICVLLSSLVAINLEQFNKLNCIKEIKNMF